MTTREIYKSCWSMVRASRAPEGSDAYCRYINAGAPAEGAEYEAALRSLQERGFGMPWGVSCPYISGAYITPRALWKIKHAFDNEDEF
jgi:hypothetical protein